MPEDASEDEDYDETIGGVAFEPKGIAPQKSIESTTNVQTHLKKSLVTCTTTNTTSRLNEDIYLNNGNAELKLPKPPIKPIHLQQQSTTIEQDSTKVEAESDRGSKNLQPRKLKVKKSRVAASVDKKTEGALGSGTQVT